MKSIFFTFLLACVLLVSCEDVSTTDNNILLKVTVLDGASGPVGDLWIFITATDGTLIGIKKAVEGEDLVFNRPDNFTDDKINVHQIIAREPVSSLNNEYILTSYTSVSENKMTLQPPASYDLTTVGNHNFVITNVPNSYVPLVITENSMGGSFERSSNTITGTVAIHQNNTKVLFWIRDNLDNTVIPRYHYTTNASTSLPSTLNMNTFTEASKKTYTFDSEVDHATFNVTPLGEMFNSELVSYAVDNTASASIYYPGAVFAGYNTKIEIKTDDLSRTFQTRGAIPSQMKSLDASVNSFSQSGNTLTFTTSGSFDYLSVNSLKSWPAGGRNVIIQWSIFAASAEGISFPAIPAELIERYPSLDGRSIEFSRVTLHEENSLTSYNEFVKREWSKKTEPDATEVLTLSRTFDIGLH